MKSKPTARLEDWMPVRGGGPYEAPERAGVRIVGRVYDKPAREDGTQVKTSRVVHVLGCLISTEGGSVYRLGEPKTDWLTWLADNDMPFDPETPLVLVAGVEG